MSGDPRKVAKWPLFGSLNHSTYCNTRANYPCTCGLDETVEALAELVNKARNAVTEMRDADERDAAMYERLRRASYELNSILATFGAAT